MGPQGFSECFRYMRVRIWRSGRCSTGRSSWSRFRQRICKHSIIRQDHRALDHVLKFAYVAGPRIGDECGHGFRGNRIDLLAHPAVEDVDELLAQRWDIFAARAKWREVDGKHVQPEAQVSAYFPPSYHRREISVRRRH